MTKPHPWLPTFSLKAENKDIMTEVSRYLTSLIVVDYGATDEDLKLDMLTLNLACPTLKLSPKGTRLILEFDTHW